MISVTILGTGNLAQHLIRVFKDHPEINLIQVYGRNKTSLKTLPAGLSTTCDINQLSDRSHLYLTAISDDAITTFTANFPLKNKLLVHTSGAQPLNAIKNTARKGVFYPVQTFSKDAAVDFSTVPICVEASNPKDEKMLLTLAKSLSNAAYTIDSLKRKQLHLAAVFANNFTNYCYTLACEICEENDIPFDILLPLIQETAQKTTQTTPLEAQTGPARRNDKKTIAAHLTLLDNQKKEIYERLTRAIQQTYGKKL